jgi:hypothetical protein
MAPSKSPTPLLRYAVILQESKIESRWDAAIPMTDQLGLTGARAISVPYGAGSGGAWRSLTVTQVTLTCAYSYMEQDHTNCKSARRLVVT